MGIIQRLKEKPQIKARATSAIMGSLMIAGMGAALVTGQASAMDAGTYFSNTSILTYIFGGLAVVMGIGTILLEDIRVGILTGVFGALALITAYLHL